ncbi:hypothetical protein DXG01_008466 [Tephrocybe rancida]|nr:hypothetical protein DXG01_008466 [Tephrocybe rancida]
MPCPTLISSWPPRHIKCSVSTCQFPNPPQAAPGKYQCKAGFLSGGHFCDGVFRVSRSVADDVMRAHKADMQRWLEEEHLAQLKAARLEERKRTEVLQQGQAQQLAPAGPTATLETDKIKATGSPPDKNIPKSLCLERRPAQRKHKFKAIDEIPPGSNEYHARPRAGLSLTRRDVQGLTNLAPPQFRQRSISPMPIQHHPPSLFSARVQTVAASTPSLCTERLVGPPASHLAIPPVRPPRRDFEYKYTGRFVVHFLVLWRVLTS